MPKISDRDKSEVREAINNAYAAVKGGECVNSLASFTYEEALSEQNHYINYDDSRMPSRPNAMHRVDRVEERLKKMVDKLKSWPDDAFYRPEEGVHLVNPPEDEE